MRLICPRCGAQYEVDDSVIPTSGRDVQCSGCGQTWFQPSRQMLDAAQEQAREAEDGLDQWDVAPEVGATAAPAPDTPLPETVEQDGAAEATGALAEVEDWPEPAPEDWPEFDAEPEPEPTPAPVAETAPEPPETASPAPEDEEVLDWAIPPSLGAAEPEPADLETDVSHAIAELMRVHPVAPPAEPAAPVAAAPEPEPPAATPDPAEVGPAPRAGAIPRRPLDENLMAILREEAEREAAARRAEGTGIETQEEMNLDRVLTSPPIPAVAPPPVTPVAPVHPQRLVSTLRADPPRRMPDFSDLNSEEEEDRHADLTEGPEPEEAESEGRFLRRRRLPDIDEINSSLRASADRDGDVAAMGMFPGRQEDRSGFRFGFSSVLLLAAIAALIYAYAPHLAQLVPGAEPLLDSYVAAVDAARIWLDAQLRAVIAQVQAGAQPQS